MNFWQNCILCYSAQAHTIEEKIIKKKIWKFSPDNSQNKEQLFGLQRYDLSQMSLVCRRIKTSYNTSVHLNTNYFSAVRMKALNWSQTVCLWTSVPEWSSFGMPSGRLDQNILGGPILKCFDQEENNWSKALKSECPIVEEIYLILSWNVRFQCMFKIISFLGKKKNPANTKMTLTKPWKTKR